MTDNARTALMERLTLAAPADSQRIDCVVRTDDVHQVLAALRMPDPDMRTMADEMRHELFIVGNHPALGVDRVMVDRWLRRLDAALSADSGEAFAPCEKCAESPGWGAVSAEYCDVWATMVPVVQRCACWLAWHERHTAARLAS